MARRMRLTPGRATTWTAVVYHVILSFQDRPALNNPTAPRLQQAALARFAAQGFDATSMNEIAADAGIKKPSVYAHFQNKDELFLSLIPLLIEAELARARAALPGGPGLPDQILAYLKSIQQEFDASPRVRFWLRTLFSPPSHLYDEVMTPMHLFMDEMEAIFRQAFLTSPFAGAPGALSADTLARASMSMVDSLQSELLFGGAEKYAHRLSAIWQVFECALAAPAAPGARPVRLGAV